MNDNRLKISILVPIYNTEKYIDRCITSIFNQTYQNIEAIFVDDKSPDNSIEILNSRINELKNSGVRLPDFHIIHMQENVGLPEARNVSLSYSSGDYVFFLDSDDYIPNNAIELLVNAAIENCADIVKGQFCVVNDFNEKTPRHYDYPSDKALYINNLLNWRTVPMNVWGTIYRKSLFSDNSIKFYRGYNMGEDFCVSARVAYFANKILTISEVVYYYQNNPNSISHNLTEAKANELIANSNYIVDFYKTTSEYQLFNKSIDIGRAKIKNYIICNLAPNKRGLYKSIFPELRLSKNLSYWGKFKNMVALKSPLLFKTLDRLNPNY